MAPQLLSAPSAPPSSHAPPGQGSAASAAVAVAAAKLDSLRSFAGCCSVLFNAEVPPESQLDSATYGEVAAALIQQFGAEALGDLSVSAGGGNS